MTPAETADHVLAELTLDEKLAMLHQWSPAVERLALPAFRTGAEVVHGVAWLGEATVFPQPVGMAATWDPVLLERIGVAVADELLAKHAADPSISRNVWAPVVDPLRHPLWGRNEEGFSEDPHLTAELATGYARGLRGPHPERWRTVPTLKHLLAYNVEANRDVVSMQVRDRVLHEYELPAFTGPLRAGAAGAVMPGYNLVNGRPAHTSGELIDAVRDAAEEEILVVSDAGAPTNLTTSQHCYPDPAHAHAAALRAGIDSFTDNDADAGPTIAALREALERGLISETDVDRAARRVLLTRARIGALEPGRPATAGRTADLLRVHAALAREAAGRAVVVLVDDGALPVRQPPSTIAVLGPLGDAVLPDWYSGEPRYPTSIAAAAAERWPAAELRVVDGADHVALRLPDGGYLRAAADGGLETGADRATAARLAITDWGWGLLTVADLDTGLLWTSDGDGAIRARARRPGGWVVQESFRADLDDDGRLAFHHLGSRRWLRLDDDGRLAATAADAHGATRFSPLVLRSGTAAVAEAAAGADLVLCALGNDPHLLGRETQDRPALELPPSQVALWESVRATAPDALLVLVSSYPYALDVDARAVLWTAHSQAVGYGVVDIVSGAVEPSGRLPQTWWRSTADAGDLGDYDIIKARSTYWYSEAEPLFALGHGLTGSRIRYRALAVVGIDETAVEVEVTISNDGNRHATEVVQVYTDAIEHRVAFPHRLGGHARAAVAPGAHATVRVRVPLERFAIWDTARGAMTVDPGRYLLTAGPNAVSTALRTEITLAGTAPVPHRLPLRAAAFDDLGGVELVAETPERGTALAGEGWVRFDDVERLTGPLTVRAARSGTGEARVELQVPDDGWRTFGSAVVPDGQHGWRTLDVTLVGVPPTDRGPLRVVLTGQVRLAEILRSVPAAR